MAGNGDDVRVDERFVIVPRQLMMDPDAGSQAIRLYGLLRAHADNDTAAAWPSRRHLADLMGCSRDTVDRAVRWLVDAGWLTVEARFDTDGQQTSNLYTVHAVRQGGRTHAEGGAAPTRHGTRSRGTRSRGTREIFSEDLAVTSKTTSIPAETSRPDLGHPRRHSRSTLPSQNQPVG